MKPEPRRCWHGIARILTALMLLAGPASCLTAPPPANSDSAAIGIAVTLGLGDSTPKLVYFVRLTDSANLIEQIEVSRSNYSRGNRAYLLNARPGRYVAVAASVYVQRILPGDPVASALARVFRPQRQEHLALPNGIAPRRGRAYRAGRAPADTLSSSWQRVSTSNSQTGREGKFPLLRAAHAPVETTAETKPVAISQIIEGGGDNNDAWVFTTYFSEDLVRQTAVDVRPGTFTVIGEFLVEASYGIRHGDRVQRFYHGKIDPTVQNIAGQAVFNDSSDLLVPSRGALIEARRDRAAEAEFLAKALQDLEDTGWAPIIERRLATLRAQ
ncbi:MAG: hypothetical protein IIA40_00720 [SAR324 cluster bacterium]|nr:hypothetical protein [SAR324 cluster bacterium]